MVLLSVNSSAQFCPTGHWAACQCHSHPPASLSASEARHRELGSSHAGRGIRGCRLTEPRSPRQSCIEPIA